MIQENKTQYVQMINTVKSGLLESDKALNKLESMGETVNGYYGSKEVLEESKAQFIADAINPIVNKRHIEALAKDLPRKGSKEFIEQVKQDNGFESKWESANQAKKDARATIATYYSRVLKYAFPAEKKDSVKKDFAGKLKALIDEGGKLKEANFDLVKVMGFLIQAEAVITKSK
jgi:hypothetical protein